MSHETPLEDAVRERTEEMRQTIREQREENEEMSQIVLRYSNVIEKREAKNRTLTAQLKTALEALESGATAIAMATHDYRFSEDDCNDLVLAENKIAEALATIKEKADIDTTEVS